MGRWAEAAGDELPAVDPDTGRLLADAPAPGPRTGAWSRRRTRPPRVRRLRRATVGLALLSLASAALAAWSAATVAALRDVERSWLAARSVEDERLEAERLIAAAVEPYGDPETLAAVSLGQVAREEAVHLRRLERELAARRIVDPAVSRLRDAMVSDLAGLRADLTAPRRRLGTALLPAPERLADLLRRWRLEPRAYDGGRLLALADHAVDVARRIADRPMGVTLVGLSEPDGRGRAELVTVDVDGQRVRSRALDGPAEALVAAAGLAVVSGGGTVTAYPLDPSAPPRWSASGAVVAAGAGGEDDPGVLWVGDGRRIQPFGTDGPAGPPRDVDPVWVVAGAVGPWLVRNGGSDGPIELWDPGDDRVLHRFTGGGRLVAVSDGAVAWQPPTGRALFLAQFDLADILGGSPRVSVRELALPPTDVGPGAFSRGGRYLAVPLGPSAGVISTMVLVDVPSGQLRGLRIPATSVGEASPAWVESAEGRWLIWLSREHRPVAHGTAGRRSQVLRAPVPGLRSVVAVPAGPLVGD